MQLLPVFNLRSVQHKFTLNTVISGPNIDILVIFLFTPQYNTAETVDYWLVDRMNNNRQEVY